jgi:hypothetical protein
MQKASVLASAVTGIVDGAERACALATLGEQDFAKPADVKQAVEDLESDSTKFAPYRVLKRLPNVRITFLTTVFNAAASSWCLSNHGIAHARFPY